MVSAEHDLVHGLADRVDMPRRDEPAAAAMEDTKGLVDEGGQVRAIERVVHRRVDLGSWLIHLRRSVDIDEALQDGIIVRRCCRDRSIGAARCLLVTLEEGHQLYELIDGP